MGTSGQLAAEADHSSYGRPVGAAGIGSGADAFVARFADVEIGLEDDVTVGEFYAQRTLLKREVLPSHVANAVFVLASSELSHTTGLHIPVDAGVAAAFLR